MTKSKAEASLSALQFIYPWRSYQDRFLTDFEVHLEDQHLHVVAPPGSGKTVLGLEMIHRVGKKTIVFSPTLTIRNQWRERMDECFLEDSTALATSFDIKNPATITFVTYQSLHAFFKNDCNNDEAQLLLFFQNIGIGAIVLDEAHHLKNAWWKPLYCLKQLSSCYVIALTATPPYDSESREIKKYFDLCGPIDMEIGVPELVRENNLCAHQDLIYFSEPDQKQIDAIIDYRKKLMSFVDALKNNAAFISFIKKHPFYATPEKKEEEIYENPTFFSSILIYLNASGILIEKEKIAFLGIEEEYVDFPSLNYEWVTALLQPLIVDERVLYIEDELLLSAIEKQLRKIGGLEKNKIDLVGDHKLYKSLSQNPSKLDSIAEIFKIESDSLGENLRMVILSDYIRKEFLEFEDDKPTSDIDKLGVLPIFQRIRRKIKEEIVFSIEDSDTAVLTGSLVVVHQSLISLLRTKIDPDYFTHRYIGGGYVLITPTTQGKKTIVAVITTLFHNGVIKVIVGTKSLLGEGWDAPAINTLVLASFVGSFVMSNQMRGRAIRVQPKNPNKTANVWHIACLDPTVEDGGKDLDILIRRFDAFCGISLTGDCYISSGFDRLNILNELKEIESLNQKMKGIALKRTETKLRWTAAIGSGKNLVRELKLDFQGNTPFKKQKQIYYQDALKFAMIELVTAVLITLPELLLKNFNVLVSKGVLYFIYAILTGVLMLFLPKTIKAIRLYLKFGRRDKEVIKIAKILRQVLVDQRIIKTPALQVRVQIDHFEDGTISCYLLGASAKESILYIDYLQEVISAIENPRYIITQAVWLRKKLGFSNYYSVPSLFSDHKKKASIFFQYWRRTYPKAQLFFTRNKDGRKLLLKARFQSFESGDRIKSKKAMIWK